MLSSSYLFHSLEQRFQRGCVCFAKCCMSGGNTEFDYNAKSRQLKKMRNAYALKKMNWLNFKLYGPMLRPKGSKKSRATMMKLKPHPVDQDLERVLQNNYSLANQCLLGNKQRVDRQMGIEELQKCFSYDAARPEDLQSCLCLESQKSHRHDYPLFCSQQITKDALRMNACKLLEVELDQLDSVDDQPPPAVGTVLNAAVSQSENFRVQKEKLDFVNEFGVATYHAYREALKKIENGLHTSIQAYFNGTPLESLPLDPFVRLHWNRISDILRSVRDVTLMRTKSTHSHLKYRGLLDYVGLIENVPHLIEFVIPTSTGFITNKHAAIAATANLGIFNASSDHPVENILLVAINKDGSSVNVFKMDKTLCENAWNEWLDALKGFWEQQKSNQSTHYVNTSFK